MAHQSAKDASTRMPIGPPIGPPSTINVAWIRCIGTEGLVISMAMAMAMAGILSRDLIDETTSDRVSASLAMHTTLAPAAAKAKAAQRPIPRLRAQYPGLGQ